jgi:hypothetical protein
VTPPQAPGSQGRTVRILSDRASRPRSTSERAAAPLNALETLAIRMWSLGRQRVLLFKLATPAVWKSRRLPRWTTTATPGGPPGISTSLGLGGDPIDRCRPQPVHPRLVGRKLFGRATQRQQLRLVKGHSEPPGPGVNSAGLGIFRYETGCGTVYGHTGNLPGFTQFTAATLDGRRSVTVSANAQVVPNSKSAAVRAGFDALRRVDALAVCASLVGR